MFNIFIILFLLSSAIDVQYVTNYSVSKTILKPTFEGMEKRLHVKFVENHSNGTQHWLVIEKLCTRAVQEISIAVSVAYGNSIEI